MASTTKTGKALEVARRACGACLVLAMLVLLGYAVVSMMGPRIPGSPNRVTIRNSAASRAEGVRLVLRPLDGEGLRVKEVPALEPGDSLTVRHAWNDVSAKLRFSLDGKAREHEEPYIDLWTGEGWILDIQGDGTVESGYDYPD